MKVKALIYCTKAKPQLVKHNNGYNLNNLPKCNWELKEYEEVELNGKIVCECEIDTEEIECVRADFNDFIEYHYITKHLQEKELIKRSCVDFPKLQNYLRLNNGYALHLSNVKERVMDLSRCYSQWQVDHLNVEEYFIHIKGIEKAPQNMQWVYILNHEDKLEKRLLISVRPEWVCKILNGEKDIEVRRKVLKGMCE